MAFLDKLTDAAAAIGDKANEAIEVTKIKTKINGEKKDLEGDFAQLGRIYYDLIKAGTSAEQEALDLTSAIDDRKEVLAALEEELKSL